VVAERAGAAVRVSPGDRVTVEVEAVHVTEDHPYARKRRGQRDRDPPGFEDAGGHLGQQRQIEEVVGRVDDDDLGAAPGELGQLAGGRETGEAAADDDDPWACHKGSFRRQTDRMPHSR
jgi:hypothetical protein